MSIRIAAMALLVWTFAVMPSGAAPAPVKTVWLSIARSAGTCPTTVAIEVRSTRYEGGYTLDVAAGTARAAYVSELLSATPQQFAFEAALRPAYASCEGSGRSKDGLYRLALHGGKLSYVVRPGKGPNGTPPSLRNVSVEGAPRITMSFSD